MEITKDKVVSITYELRKDKKDGEVVEQVSNENPLTFVYGLGQMLPKFEEYLSGLKKGAGFEFGLNTEDAYGPVIDNAVVEVPVDVFKVDGEIDKNILKVGNMVPMMDNSGNRMNGLVKEVTDIVVKMDFNHPMAGKDLFFKGEVTEVRDATPEELAPKAAGGCDCGDGGCGDGNCEEKGSCDDNGGSCGCDNH